MTMQQLHVTFVVDTEAAVRAGLSQSGRVTMPLDAGALTAEQREILLGCPLNTRNGCSNYDIAEYQPQPHSAHYQLDMPAVGAATMEAVTTLLDARPAAIAGWKAKQATSEAEAAEYRATAEARREKDRQEAAASAAAYAERTKQLMEENKAKAAEEARWIKEHGSSRLRRLLEAEIEHDAVYFDERLAHELPEWRYDLGETFTDSEPRNVSEQALDLLDRAKAALPGAALRYITLYRQATEDEMDDADKDGDVVDRRFYAAQSRFLGRKVWLTDPVAVFVADL